MIDALRHLPHGWFSTSISPFPFLIEHPDASVDRQSVCSPISSQKNNLTTEQLSFWRIFFHSMKILDPYGKNLYGTNARKGVRSTVQLGF